MPTRDPLPCRRPDCPTLFLPRNRVQVYCSDRCGTIAKRRRYNRRVRHLASLYRISSRVVVAGVWLGRSPSP